MLNDFERRIGNLLPRALALALAFAALTPTSCSQQSDSEKQAKPVSHTPPKLEPLPAPAPAVAVRPPVPSEGDCAPRYAKGGKGTCINNQPCRGFGVRAENGSAVCTCFGRDGGCGGGQRCDPKKLGCVPETESPFGHGEVD
jgi:hypothetical protein